MAEGYGSGTGFFPRSGSGQVKIMDPNLIGKPCSVVSSNILVCPLQYFFVSLDLHVRMVHTDMPEWPCPDCGKKFKRKFDLNRHRVTVHLGVRNFPCYLCGKRFADMKVRGRGG